MAQEGGTGWGAYNTTEQIKGTSNTCRHIHMYMLYILQCTCIFLGLDHMACSILNIVHCQCTWAGSALRSRTVRQKEKKRSFVVLVRRSIHKSCPRTHNHVLFLWRIVIMQGQWRIQRHVLGDIVKKQHTVYLFMCAHYTQVWQNEGSTPKVPF